MAGKKVLFLNFCSKDSGDNFATMAVAGTGFHVIEN
jgi:hypothetical protein